MARARKEGITRADNHRALVSLIMDKLAHVDRFRCTSEEKDKVIERYKRLLQQRGPTTADRPLKRLRTKGK